MNKKAKFIAVIAAPLLALGLVACQTPTSSTTPNSSKPTPTTPVVDPTTPPVPVSTPTPSTPVPVSSTTVPVSSTTVPVSSTVAPTTSTGALVDEIVGTPAERKATFGTHSKGDKASFFGVFMTSETFTPNMNVNAYFLDGDQPYRVTNVQEADVADLVIGKVYKITGQYNNSSTISQSNATVDFSAELVDGGETKISATILDLNTTELAAGNQYGIVTGSKLVVTETTSSTLKVKAANGIVYTLSTRGLNEDDVLNKFKQAAVDVEVTINEGVVSNVGNKAINILKTDAITIGEAKVYTGSIAQDADVTGGVTATVVDGVITFGSGVIVENDEGKNVVAVTLTKPSDLVSTEKTKILVNNDALTWTNDDASTLTINLEIASKSDIVIKVDWAGNGAEQVFTVKFGANVKLADTVVGTITADQNSDLGGAPTGSMSKDDPITVSQTGDVITFGSAGEVIAYYAADEALGRAAGNRVGVQINKPEGAVDSQIRITIGEKVYTWDEAKNGDDYFWVYPLVTAPNQEFTVTVHWADDTDVYKYEDQVFTIKIAEGIMLQAATVYAGTITGDPNSDLDGAPTGSIDKDHPLTVKVEGDVITFGTEGEQIAYYAADEALGREAGNRVGVQINKPEGVDDSEIRITIAGKVYTWEAIKDGDDYFWYYPLVTNAGQEFKVICHWIDNTELYAYEDQVFTIKIAEGVDLVGNFAGTITPDQNSDLDGAPTGSIDSANPISVSVSGNDIVFGSKDEVIAFYDADESLGREAGNRVGVQINKPEGVDDSEIRITIAGKVYTWEAIKDGDDYFWYYPLVTVENRSFTVTCHWADDTEQFTYNDQVFNIRIADGVKLQSFINGSIEVDQNSDLEGAPTGSLDKEHALTVKTEGGDVITIGAAGEVIAYYGADEALGRAAGNRVGVQINKPEGAVDSQIRITIGEKVYTWDEAKNGDDYFWVYPLVTAAGQEYTVKIRWADDTADYVYNEQVFTIKVAEGVVLEECYTGTIEGDPNSDLGGAATGSVSADDPITVVVEGNVITFGGRGEYIDYYTADEALGRTAGNRVGVQISKPANLPEGVTPILFINGSETPLTWVESADGVIWWYPLITEENISQDQTMTIHWSGRAYDGNAQTFTVRIAVGTELVGSYLSNIQDISVTDISAKTESEYDQLYRFTGIVTEIKNTTYGNLHLADPLTGETMYVYGLMDDESIFYSHDGTKAPTNNKTFNKLGVAVGDMVTVVGVQFFHNTTHEATGYAEKLIKAADYTIDLSKSVSVNDVTYGSAILSSESAHYGAEVTVTITPVDGYVAKSALVNGDAVDIVDNKIVFKVAAYNEITITFEEAVTYTVTLADVTNGSAALSASTGVYGDTITVTVTPESGYVVKSVMAGDVAATVSEDNANVYTFTLIGSVTVTVTLISESEAPIRGATYNWTPTTKFDGTPVNVNDVTWTITPTWKGNVSWQNYDKTKGVQIGSSSNPATAVEIATSDYVGGIDKIVINTSGASSINCTLEVTVGGVVIGEKIKLTTTATEYEFISDTILEGEIKLSYVNSSTKAIYFKSIVINPAA